MIIDHVDDWSNIFFRKRQMFEWNFDSNSSIWTSNQIANPMNKLDIHKWSIDESISEENRSDLMSNSSTDSFSSIDYWQRRKTWRESPENSSSLIPSAIISAMFNIKSNEDQKNPNRNFVEILHYSSQIHFHWYSNKLIFQWREEFEWNLGQNYSYLTFISILDLIGDVLFLSNRSQFEQNPYQNDFLLIWSALIETIDQISSKINWRPRTKFSFDWFISHLIFVSFDRCSQIRLNRNELRNEILIRRISFQSHLLFEDRQYRLNRTEDRYENEIFVWTRHFSSHLFIIERFPSFSSEINEIAVNNSPSHYWHQMTL